MPGEDLLFGRIRQAADITGMPLVAAGDVSMHDASQKPLQDTMTAIRLGKPLAECGYDLQPNAEQYLRSRLQLEQIYPLELLRRRQALPPAVPFRWMSCATSTPMN